MAAWSFRNDPVIRLRGLRAVNVQSNGVGALNPKLLHRHIGKIMVRINLVDLT
jgi:hypothetical protein